jgi:hypothetical protein
MISATMWSREICMVRLLGIENQPPRLPVSEEMSETQSRRCAGPRTDRDWRPGNVGDYFFFLSEAFFPDFGLDFPLGRVSVLLGAFFLAVSGNRGSDFGSKMLRSSSYT